MRSRKWVLWCMFFSFFFSHASDIPVEYRLQNYLNTVDRACAAHPADSPKRAIVLLKVALGVTQGDDFSPDEEAVLYLLRNSYLNPFFKDPHTGGSFLHFAALYGAYDVLRYLLDEVHLSIEVDREGKTPLHWAAAPYHKTPRKDVIELLLGAKKDLLHVRDFYGKTPLFYLPSFSEVGDFLLSLGLNIDAKDTYGRTALFAVKNEADTQYLCSRGIDVNAVDERKLTVLGAYLTTYSSRCDATEEQSNQVKIDDLKKGIKALVNYGAFIPRMYHPACEMPLGRLEKERARRIHVLQSALGDSLRHMEETLEWTKTRLALSKKDKKIKTVSPLLVVDTYSSALPFFKARYLEMQEIMGRKKRFNPALEEDVPNDVVFGDFLARLSFSKQISSTLSCMAWDLVCNYEEYEIVHGFPEGERIRIGQSILNRLFPSEYPDDHAA